MIKLGRYKHYKGGIYVVLLCATDDATKEIVVVYMNEKHGTYYTRKLEDFKSDVNGLPRFELINE